MNNYPLQNTHMNDVRDPYANRNSRQPEALGFLPAAPSAFSQPPTYKTRGIPYPFNKPTVSGPSPTRPCTPPPLASSSARINDASASHANPSYQQPEPTGLLPRIAAAPSVVPRPAISKTRPIPFPFNKRAVSGPSPTRPCTPPREEAPLALINDASAPHAIPVSRQSEPTGLLPALTLTPSAFTEPAKRKPSDPVPYPSKRRTVSGPILTRTCTPPPLASSSAAVVGGRSPAALVNESPRLLRQAKIKTGKQRSCSAPIRPCTPPPSASVAGRSSPTALVTESPRMARKAKMKAVVEMRSSRPYNQPSPCKEYLNKYNWTSEEHAPQNRINTVTYDCVRLPQTPTKKRSPTEFADEGPFKIKDEAM